MSEQAVNTQNVDWRQESRERSIAEVAMHCTLKMLHHQLMNRMTKERRSRQCR